MNVEALKHNSGDVKQKIPLYFLSLLMFIPTLNSYFTWPNPSFHFNYFATLCTTVFLFVSLLLIKPVRYFPKTSVYVMATMCLFCIQLFLLDFSYPLHNLATIAVFVIMTAMTWVIVSLKYLHGSDKVLTFIAFGLTIGAIIQGLISILQFTGLAIHFQPYIFMYDENVVGHLRQRNLLADYMFIGFFSANYLLYREKISKFWGYLLIIFIAATLGLMNSRNIILYILTSGLVAFIALLVSDKSYKSAIRMIFINLFIVVFFQLFMLDILNLFMSIDAKSALDRVGNGAIAPRLWQWQLAFEIFMDNPILGVGLDNYAINQFNYNANSNTTYYNLIGESFNHSHNAILQILAETGIVGGIVIIGGLILIITNFIIKNKNHYNGLFIILLFLPIFIHSMLEYPLWHVVFLNIFFCLLALTENRIENVKAISSPLLPTISLIFIFGTFYHIAYYNLVSNSRIDKTSSVTINKSLENTESLVRRIPVLRNWVELDVSYQMPISGEYNKKYHEILLKLTDFRPYFYENLKLVTYYHQNKQQEKAKNLLLKTIKYYPCKNKIVLNNFEKKRKFSELSAISKKFQADNKDIIEQCNQNNNRKTTSVPTAATP